MCLPHENGRFSFVVECRLFRKIPHCHGMGALTGLLTRRRPTTISVSALDVQLLGMNVHSEWTMDANRITFSRGKGELSVFSWAELTPCNWVLFVRSCQSLSYSWISQPEGSLPWSHDISGGPYTQPDQSIPYHPIPSYASKIHFNIILPHTFYLAT
jgi:hypothetical protein